MSEDEMRKLIDQKDTVILDLVVALREIEENPTDAEKVYSTASYALRAIYGEPEESMEAIWGGWV